MEFIFDEEKMKTEGFTEEECLRQVRNHFSKFKSKTLKETKKGVFEGNDDEDWEAFACASWLPYEGWFLKVIKEWYWYYDEEDGKGIQKGDCLKSYYKYNKNDIRSYNF